MVDGWNWQVGRWQCSALKEPKVRPCQNSQYYHGYAQLLESVASPSEPTFGNAVSRHPWSICNWEEKYSGRTNEEEHRYGGPSSFFIFQLPARLDLLVHKNLLKSEARKYRTFDVFALAIPSEVSSNNERTTTAYRLWQSSMFSRKTRTKRWSDGGPHDLSPPQRFYPSATVVITSANRPKLNKMDVLRGWPNHFLYSLG